ncbi:type II secretion system F family protein [soil metagenome]
MSALLGALLAAGVLLCASPLLWPRRRGGMPRHSALGALWRERLAQAGLERITPGMVGAVSLVVGVAVASVAFALLPVAVLALAAGAAALALPTLLISWRSRAHRRATRVVWPDVVDHLVSTVRAGLALPDGVASLAASGPTLTRAAFAAFADDYRVTGNFGACLDTLKGRLADPVADRVLETLRMSREVGGGELTTILRNLGVYLREEAAIRSEIEARQSWVMNAAKLGVAAPWIVLALLATRPEAAAAYATPGGTALIVVGLSVSVVAYRVMLAIGRLPEERRWFA